MNKRLRIKIYAVFMTVILIINLFPISLNADGIGGPSGGSGMPGTGANATPIQLTQTVFARCAYLYPVIQDRDTYINGDDTSTLFKTYNGFPNAPNATNQNKGFYIVLDNTTDNSGGLNTYDKRYYGWLDRSKNLPAYPYSTSNGVTEHSTWNVLTQTGYGGDRTKSGAEPYTILEKMFTIPDAKNSSSNPPQHVKILLGGNWTFQGMRRDRYSVGYKPSTGTKLLSDLKINASAELAAKVDTLVSYMVADNNCGPAFADVQYEHFLQFAKNPASLSEPKFRGYIAANALANMILVKAYINAYPAFANSFPGGQDAMLLDCLKYWTGDASAKKEYLPIVEDVIGITGPYWDNTIYMPVNDWVEQVKATPGSSAPISAYKAQSRLAAVDSAARNRSGGATINSYSYNCSTMQQKTSFMAYYLFTFTAYQICTEQNYNNFSGIISNACPIFMQYLYREAYDNVEEDIHMTQIGSKSASGPYTGKAQYDYNEICFFGTLNAVPGHVDTSQPPPQNTEGSHTLIAAFAADPNNTNNKTTIGGTDLNYNWLSNPIKETMVSTGSSTPPAGTQIAFSLKPENVVVLAKQIHDKTSAIEDAKDRYIAMNTAKISIDRQNNCADGQTSTAFTPLDGPTFNANNGFYSLKGQFPISIGEGSTPNVQQNAQLEMQEVKTCILPGTYAKGVKSVAIIKMDPTTKLTFSRDDYTYWYDKSRGGSGWDCVTTETEFDQNKVRGYYLVCLVGVAEEGADGNLLNINSGINNHPTVTKVYKIQGTPSAPDKTSGKVSMNLEETNFTNALNKIIANGNAGVKLESVNKQGGSSYIFATSAGYSSGRLSDKYTISCDYSTDDSSMYVNTGSSSQPSDKITYKIDFRTTGSDIAYASCDAYCYPNLNNTSAAENDWDADTPTYSSSCRVRVAYENNAQIVHENCQISAYITALPSGTGQYSFTVTSAGGTSDRTVDVNIPVTVTDSSGKSHVSTNGNLNENAIPQLKVNKDTTENEIRTWLAKYVGKIYTVQNIPMAINTDVFSQPGVYTFLYDSEAELCIHMFNDRKEIKLKPAGINAYDASIITSLNLNSSTDSVTVTVKDMPIVVEWHNEPQAFAEVKQGSEIKTDRSAETYDAMTGTPTMLDNGEAPQEFFLNIGGTPFFVGVEAECHRDELTREWTVIGTYKYHHHYSSGDPPEPQCDLITATSPAQNLNKTYQMNYWTLRQLCVYPVKEANLADYQCVSRDSGESAAFYTKMLKGTNGFTDNEGLSIDFTGDSSSSGSKSCTFTFNGSTIKITTNYTHTPPGEGADKAYYCSLPSGTYQGSDVCSNGSSAGGSKWAMHEVFAGQYLELHSDHLQIDVEITDKANNKHNESYTFLKGFDSKVELLQRDTVATSGGSCSRGSDKTRVTGTYSIFDNVNANQGFPSKSDILKREKFWLASDASSASPDPVTGYVGTPIWSRELVIPTIGYNGLPNKDYFMNSYQVTTTSKGALRTNYVCTAAEGKKSETTQAQTHVVNSIFHYDKGTEKLPSDFDIAAKYSSTDTGIAGYTGTAPYKMKLTSSALQNARYDFLCGVLYKANRHKPADWDVTKEGAYEWKTAKDLKDDGAEIDSVLRYNDGFLKENICSPTPYPFTCTEKSFNYLNPLYNEYTKRDPYNIADFMPLGDNSITVGGVVRDFIRSGINPIILYNPVSIQGSSITYSTMKDQRVSSSSNFNLKADGRFHADIFPYNSHSMKPNYIDTGLSVLIDTRMNIDYLGQKGSYVDAGRGLLFSEMYNTEHTSGLALQGSGTNISPKARTYKDRYNTDHPNYIGDGYGVMGKGYQKFDSSGVIPSINHTKSTNTIGWTNSSGTAIAIDKFIKRVYVRVPIDVIWVKGNNKVFVKAGDVIAVEKGSTEWNNKTLHFYVAPTQSDVKGAQFTIWAQAVNDIRTVMEYTPQQVITDIAANYNISPIVQSNYMYSNVWKFSDGGTVTKNDDAYTGTANQGIQSDWLYAQGAGATGNYSPTKLTDLSRMWQYSANYIRTAGNTAPHYAFKSCVVDIVGRVGNFLVDDCNDPNYQDYFRKDKGTYVTTTNNIFDRFTTRTDVNSTKSMSLYHGETQRNKSGILPVDKTYGEDEHTNPKIGYGFNYSVQTIGGYSDGTLNILPTYLLDNKEVTKMYYNRGDNQFVPSYGTTNPSYILTRNYGEPYSKINSYNILQSTIGSATHNLVAEANSFSNASSDASKIKIVADDVTGQNKIVNLGTLNLISLVSSYSGYDNGNTDIDTIAPIQINKIYNGLDANSESNFPEEAAVRKTNTTVYSIGEDTNDIPSIFIGSYHNHKRWLGSLNLPSSTVFYNNISQITGDALDVYFKILTPTCKSVRGDLYESADWKLIADSTTQSLTDGGDTPGTEGSSDDDIRIPPPGNNPPPHHTDGNGQNSSDDPGIKVIRFEGRKSSASDLSLTGTH